jgi:hypothetical protein
MVFFRKRRQTYEVPATAKPGPDHPPGRAAFACAQTAIVEKLIGKVGVAGQAKKNRWRTYFLTPLLLTSCAGPEALFTGQTRPLAGTCDPPSTAILTLRHRAVAFAPNTGTLVLKGTADQAGHLTADLTLQGIDHKPYRLTLDATHQAHTIEGTYTTPRCRYAISLRQTQN